MDQAHDSVFFLPCNWNFPAVNSDQSIEVISTDIASLPVCLCLYLYNLLNHLIPSTKVSILPVIATRSFDGCSFCCSMVAHPPQNEAIVAVYGHVCPNYHSELSIDRDVHNRVVEMGGG